MNQSRVRFPGILVIKKLWRHPIRFSATKYPHTTFQVSLISKNFSHLANIGYGGFIPGVKSENRYGETYGKTTYASAACKITRGIDLPVEVKF